MNEISSEDSRRRCNGLYGRDDARGSSRPFQKEIVTLVVDDDECGEILDVNLPHGLHAELWELEDVDFFNVVLGENGGGTARWNRGKNRRESCTRE